MDSISVVQAKISLVPEIHLGSSQSVPTKKLGETTKLELLLPTTAG